VDTKYLELNNICKASLAKAFLIAVVVAVEPKNYVKFDSHSLGPTLKL